jgi:hypothetical protein
VGGEERTDLGQAGRIGAGRDHVHFPIRQCSTPAVAESRFRPLLRPGRCTGYQPTRVSWHAQRCTCDFARPIAAVFRPAPENGRQRGIMETRALKRGRRRGRDRALPLLPPQAATPPLVGICALPVGDGVVSLSYNDILSIHRFPCAALSPDRPSCYSLRASSRISTGGAHCRHLFSTHSLAHPPTFFSSPSSPTATPHPV